MRKFSLLSPLILFTLCIVLMQDAIAGAESIAVPSEANGASPQPRVAKPEHPLDGVSRMTLQMSYDPFVTAYPIIYLKVNGSEPQPFLFDTGYTGTILMDEAAAKKLKVNILDSSAATIDANGVKKQLRKASVDTLEMVLDNGGVAPWSKPFIVVGSSLPIANEQFTQTPVVGIVGIGAFLGPTLYFDFENHTLEILPGAHPDVATITSAVSVPFTIEADGIKADFGKVLASKQSLLVDTGALHSSLSKELIQKTKPSLSFDSGSIGLASTRHQKSYLVDTLAFEKIPMSHLLVDEAGKKGPILGMDILSRFRVTIDTRRKKLVLEPTQRLLDLNKLYPGYCGLVVDRRNGNINIAHAVNKYKELVGTTIVAIDDARFLGKTIKDIPVAQVQSVLDGYADTEVTITIRATGVDKNVTIKRMTYNQK